MTYAQYVTKYVVLAHYPLKSDTSLDIHGGLVGLYETQELCVLADYQMLCYYYLELNDTSRRHYKETGGYK